MDSKVPEDTKYPWGLAQSLAQQNAVHSRKGADSQKHRYECREQTQSFKLVVGWF